MDLNGPSRDHLFATYSRALVAVLLLFQMAAQAAELIPVPALGLRVARGFRVTQFADESLANDIYALAINPRGEVVVTGQGYIRTLLDRDNDGVADTSVEFARTPTGGMGLCFDGDELMFVGDGALWRFRDVNGDRQADGPPQRLLSLASGEHGGHAVRKGPDGLWYVIGGNDSNFDPTQINLSLVRASRIEGGALLRIGADGQGAEAIAHGFRNPYDFDFNAEGDLFTYDSDVERDYFLPWYTPTRIYHVLAGGHHGWRLNGYLRSWARRGYDVDTVETVEELGRGSPTGLACYNHLQFPNYYRGGLFALDWTFGRVHFLPLEPDGASYGAVAEVFLDAIGTHGFAPTDAAVGLDGSLFISTGGRRTRGAVYRVQYVGEPARRTLATNWIQTSTSQLQAVLRAPQPLEGWSRALWVPMAQRLGAEPIALVAADNRATPEQRIRAIEILTELFGGLAPETAAAAGGASSPAVRARSAWSLGVAPYDNVAPVLLGLARDVSPYVRRAALEALHRRAANLQPVAIQQALALNLAHPDKRVRQSAALLATDLPEPAWRALWSQQQSGLPQAKLTTALAHLWRAGSTQVNTAAVESALAVLNQAPAAELRLQAVRLIILGLGDYNLEKPALETYTAYSTPFSLTEFPSLHSRLEKTVSGLFPSADQTLNFEVARLLAIIESRDSRNPERLTAFWDQRSTPTSDFHFLTVFSRLRAPSVSNHTEKIADTIVSLDRKLAGLQQRPKQNWSTRLTELTGALIKNDPRLVDAMMRHPDFARPGNLPLVPLLGANRYTASARLFLASVQRDPNFLWSDPLIDLLAALPTEETHPLFRRQLLKGTLRDRLLIELAAKPQDSDREHFVAGLASVRPDTVRSSMSALLQLPNDAGTKTHAAALRLLRALLKDPKEQTMRAQALALLTRVSGEKFTIRESGTDLARAYQPVFDRFGHRYPGLIRQLDSDDAENPAQWEAFYKAVPWTQGAATRGEVLFSERGCVTCHSGGRALGPDLGGAAQRFSPADLFNAVIFPNRDVAPAYRMTTFHLRNGETYSGMVTFESADGVMVQTSLASTVRLAEDDILRREPSVLSFMPSGLLTGLAAQDFADLHSYLKSLPSR